MFLNFDNIDVAVANSGIVSTSASISTSNVIEGMYILGYAKPIGQMPNGGIKTTFTASYIPEISKEPNFSIANNIRNLINDNNYHGERIEFAGLYNDNFYMDSYSLKIQSNNLVEATINYTTYWELCGNLRPKSNLIQYYNQGDLCHSWVTNILDQNDKVLNPTYDISYDFMVNWQPVYTIGKQTPIEVKLLGISESLSFTIDNYRTILFTGENVYPNIFTGNQGDLKFNNISLLCNDNCDSIGSPSSYLSLNINGFKIKTINTAASVNEMVRTNYVATRYN